MGFIVLTCCILLGINGTAASITSRFGQQADWTPKERNLKIARIHRWLGTITLALAGVTLSSGIIKYSFMKNRGERDQVLKVLGNLHGPVFGLTFIGLEVCFRIWRRQTKVLVAKVSDAQV
jgi:hypothetical protein